MLHSLSHDVRSHFIISLAPSSNGEPVCDRGTTLHLSETQETTVPFTYSVSWNVSSSNFKLLESHLISGWPQVSATPWVWSWSHVAYTFL